MFSKPLKPVEKSSPKDDKPKSESLKTKVQAISDSITENDYRIETIIKPDGTEEHRIVIDGKFLKEKLAQHHLKYNLEKSNKFTFVNDYSDTTATDSTFGPNAKERFQVSQTLYTDSEIVRVTTLKKKD